MKTSIIAVVALSTVLVSGCATKRYPIATTFSQAEAAAMDCGDLNLELIRAEQVQAQIADTANMDWRSAAGFLGDFGIGNAMARSDADRAITRRVAAIREAQASMNCNATSAISTVRNFVDNLFN